MKPGENMITRLKRAEDNIATNMIRAILLPHFCMTKNWTEIITSKTVKDAQAGHFADSMLDKEITTS